MLKTLNKGHTRYWFDSLPELARYIETTPRKWRANTSQTDASRSWDLNVGYKGACNLARDGWLDGAQNAENALKAFPPMTPEYELAYNVHGFRPSVPRYLSGLPTNMACYVEKPDTGQGKVLTLIIAAMANASTSAEHMANYGIALAQYVNQLETTGTRVEVIGACSSEGSGVRLTYAWRVKSADQPLDLAVLAFAIGHPAMVRRIGFAFMERSDCREMSGYGSARQIDVKDVVNAPLGAIVLNGMQSASSCAKTPELALAHITAQIDKAQKAREY